MRPLETIHEDGFDAAFGLLEGWVCTTSSRAEVERRLALQATGTRAGWQIKGGPVPCSQRPGYHHYIVEC